VEIKKDKERGTYVLCEYAHAYATVKMDVFRIESILK
jgi:hypothetical protein